MQNASPDAKGITQRNSADALGEIKRIVDLKNRSQLSPGVGKCHGFYISCSKSQGSLTVHGFIYPSHKKNRDY